MRYYKYTQGMWVEELVGDLIGRAFAVQNIGDMGIESVYNIDLTRKAIEACLTRESLSQSTTIKKPQSL